MKIPANEAKPWLLVDVDGVISLFGFDPARRPPGSFQTVDGIAHYLSATAGEHLRALAEFFALAWCTGWEEKANEYLPHALGLPGPLPYVELSGGSGPEDHESTPGHWKLAPIDRFAGPDRALAWIDDDHANCENWARSRPGPTLLVTTIPDSGMGREHVDELVAWAA